MATNLPTRLFGATLLILSWVDYAVAAGVREFPWVQPEQSLLGEISYRTLVYEDTFALIARREGVGFEALRRANPGVDAWIPGAGTRLMIPSAMLLPDAPRSGVVVNLSELRLFHFEADAARVTVYPIGVGSEGARTPVMETEVVSKLQNPTWYPPESVRDRYALQGKVLPRKVPPGPHNPLGSYAIQLARDGYFIHGTNQPMGVGRRVSSGCIRMYNTHIEEFIHRVGAGVKVSVIRQPYKVSWHNGVLYLEAHPGEHNVVEDRPSSLNHSGFVAQVIRATRERDARIDWSLALTTAREGRGIPVRISR